jgi:O-antigen/teichoic acid export membrane protein
MAGQRFVGDFFVVQLLNFVVKPLWLLVIDREVQNRLPEGDYGNYFSLLSLVLLLSVVLDPGLNNYQSSFYAKEPRLWAMGFRNSLKIKVRLSLVFMSLVFLAFFFSGLQKQSLILLAGVAGIQLLAGWILHFRSFLNAKKQFRKDGLAAASDKLIAGLFLALVLYGVLEIEISIGLFVLIQSVSLLLVALTLLIVLWNMSAEDGSHSSVESLGLKQVLSRTWPYALLSILMIAYTRSDAVMLRWLHPSGNLEVDEYAMSFRLLDAAVMIPALLAGMLLPSFSSSLHNQKELSTQVSQSLAILLFPAICFATVFVLFSASIGDLLYADRFGNQAESCMKWLLPSFIPMCMIYIFGTLLTALSELKKLNALGLIALLTNLGLNAALIPSLGAKGAALATLITQSFFALGCIWMATKVQPFHVFGQWVKENVIQIISFSASVVAVNAFSEGLLALFLVILSALLHSSYLWLRYSGALFQKRI